MSNPKGHVTHGLSNTPLYKVWQTMKQRCYNPNNRGYRWYGAKGVKLCEDWRSPTVFYNWAIKNGYQEGLTIDRIDPKGDYAPNNCRWITMSDQQHNKTSNHILTLNNEPHSMTEWSVITGIPRTTITNRIRMGWTIEEALTPKRRKRKCS